MRNKLARLLSIIAVLLLTLTPNISFACACGCGMFDVGTASTLPTTTGGIAFLQYDYVNQNQNWHGTSKSSEENNEDKKIRTDYYTLGAQYMFNRSWGLMAKAPYVSRAIKEFDEDAGEMMVTNHNSIGDVKLMGIYSGFSPNMSTGLIFGAKLPTGKTNQNNFSSDTQIGTGSTDALIGAYHLGKITDDAKFNYFTQGMWQHTTFHQDKFNPGDEVSLSAGAYYNAGRVGIISKISPMLQIIGTDKFKNEMQNISQQDSGYRKVFIAPGLEINFDKIRLYGDVQFAVYQNVNGNQLTADKTARLIAGYKF